MSATIISRQLHHISNDATHVLLLLLMLLLLLLVLCCGGVVVVVVVVVVVCVVAYVLSIAYLLDVMALSSAGRYAKCSLFSILLHSTAQRHVYPLLMLPPHGLCVAMVCGAESGYICPRSCCMVVDLSWYCDGSPCC